MIIRRYQEDDANAISRMNARLVAAGLRWEVYAERPLDARPDSPVSSRLFVARGEGDVHGAIWLREHEFLIAGKRVTAGWAKYPVAESLIDPAFAGVPGALVIGLLRQQPRLMALGLGGFDGPFARLLRGMRWAGSVVPFYFLPVRPARVLRWLRQPRRTLARRIVLDILAFSGLGYAAWQVWSTSRRLTRPTPERLAVTVVDRFESWADEIWERTSPHYRFISRRDAAMLNMAFPSEMPVVRLRLRRKGKDVGWAVVVRKAFAREDDTPFGPLRIGLIADGLSDPADATAVVHTATEHLKSSGVDLIFSNQSHRAWGGALRELGFVAGPSQFALYQSPAMAALTKENPGIDEFHINRGDCDGPVFW